MRQVTLTVMVVVMSVPAGGQDLPRRGVIDGVVTDSALVPLGDATVSFVGANLRVVTGANGRFRVRDMNPGAYVLIVRRIGFEASSVRLQLSPGDTVRPALVLQRTGTTLDTVAIVGTRLTPAMQEFEARRKLGFGQFMTQKEIERRNVEGLQDLLAMFKGVKMPPGGWPMSRRMDAVRACPYEVYVDGVKLPRSAAIDNVAFPKELAGIEVYNGPAETPLQYKATTGGGFCGVILLWTRVGS
jgi:hypothetical protein